MNWSVTLTWCALVSATVGILAGFVTRRPDDPAHMVALTGAALAITFGVFAALLAYGFTT